MGMSVVLVGSPLSGFEIWGPFKTLEDAEDWAGNVDDNEAWAVELTYPEFEQEGV